MKTVTILIFTFLLSPWTVHANGESEGAPAIESLNFTQPDTTNKQELLEKVRQRGSLRIWVHYKMEHTREGLLSEFERQQQRFEIDDKHSQFMAEIQGQNIRSINKMNSSPRAAMFVDEQALKFLFELPMLEKISEVKRLRIHTNATPFIIGANTVWGGLGKTGNGQTIVIIDTGVDYTHEMLSGKVVDGACFSTHDSFSDHYSL